MRKTAETLNILTIIFIVSLVIANVYYPENWIDKFPEFAEAMMRYQREGKNLHDDAPDCVTGVYENPKPLGGWIY